MPGYARVCVPLGGLEFCAIPMDSSSKPPRARGATPGRRRGGVPLPWAKGSEELRHWLKRQWHSHIGDRDPKRGLDGARIDREAFPFHHCKAVGRTTRWLRGASVRASRLCLRLKVVRSAPKPAISDAPAESSSREWRRGRCVPQSTREPWVNRQTTNERVRWRARVQTVVWSGMALGGHRPAHAGRQARSLA